MTIDPKALIERLLSDADRSDMGRGPDPTDHRRIAAQAVRDLTAELARRKALGDELARHARHHHPNCPVYYNATTDQCTCGLSDALAAWEKKDD